jgi:hypothetical protein
VAWSVVQHTDRPRMKCRPPVRDPHGVQAYENLAVDYIGLPFVEIIRLCNRNALGWYLKVPGSNLGRDLLSFIVFSSVYPD